MIGRLGVGAALLLVLLHEQVVEQTSGPMERVRIIRRKQTDHDNETSNCVTDKLQCTKLWF